MFSDNSKIDLQPEFVGVSELIFFFFLPLIQNVHNPKRIKIVCSAKQQQHKQRKTTSAQKSQKRG